MAQKKEKSPLDELLEGRKMAVKSARRASRHGKKIEISTLNKKQWAELEPAEREGMAIKINKQVAPKEKSKAQVKRKPMRIIYLADKDANFRPSPDLRKKDHGVPVLETFAEQREMAEKFEAAFGEKLPETKFYSTTVQPEKPKNAKKQRPVKIELSPEDEKKMMDLINQYM